MALLLMLTEIDSSAWEISYIDVWSKVDNMTVPNNTTLPPFANSTDNSTEPSSTMPFTRVTLSTADPTSVPTGANGGFIDEPTLDGWTLLGCFGSSSGYPTWEPLADLPDMDNEGCVETCQGAGKKYAGTALTTCYCADTLGDAIATSNSRCNIPCAGCYYETCGGYLNGSAPTQTGTDNGFNSTNADNTTSVLPRGRFSRRAAPADLLFTIYGRIDADVPPPPPGIGGDNGTDTGAGITITTAATATITTAITVTYTTICATNPAELVVVEYCTTLTIESCPTATATATPTGGASQSGGQSPSGAPSASGAGPITPGNGVAVETTPSVPMTTCVETCAACGENGQNTVTLTIPAAVATGGPDVVVTALTYISVVPQISNGSDSATGNGSYVPPNNGSAPTSVPVPVSVPVSVPVMAGADGSTGLVAWGFLLCLGIFGVALVL